MFLRRLQLFREREQSPLATRHCPPYSPSIAFSSSTRESAYSRIASATSGDRRRSLLAPKHHLGGPHARPPAGEADPATFRPHYPGLPAYPPHGLMESIQKLPIIRMMTRSSAPPVNNSPPQNSPQSNPPQSSPPMQPPPEVISERTPVTSPRSLRQLSVFWLGSACLLASTAITRKAVWRRQLRVKPSFYAPNTNPYEFFSPMSDALQALNMATMNCFSVGLMLLGGTMWTLDIANLKEARSILRRRLNYDSIYQSEDEAPNGLGETLLRAGETRIVEEEGDDTDTKS
ncbi:hypothetical protein OPT61_g898 [Boeremia exigua]|uniref:Uncharacterized protein n=1 Tax=Boeremia exigua TaxID=749465 RepID=A0ACC2IS72_9PLEO|nr:hypothetical protein OPT61_g898 [Boeremia exigua]